MKNITYTIYVHLNEANGEVVYSNCTCKAGKGGQCKHIVALLFQVIEYKQLDMTEIPDHLTCTQLLQQWHVPRKNESDEAVLYESIVFKKAVYEKDITTHFTDRYVHSEFFLASERRSTVDVRRRPGYKIWRLFKFEFSEVNINSQCLVLNDRSIAENLKRRQIL